MIKYFINKLQEVIPLKKKIIAGLGIAAAVGVGLKLKEFTDMSLKDRSDICSEKFVNAISKLQKDLPDPPLDSLGENENTFSEGNEYLENPSENGKWQLGYSQKSILPEDIYTKKYCIGGNTKLPANYATGVLDDIRVRTIALDDSSGRGKVVLCSVDCIGISNKNVMTLRSRLSDYLKENNICSLNIFSTHTHSSIDTMGIWGPIVEVFLNNKKTLKTGKGQIMDSVDNNYMEFLFGKITESVKEAVENMVSGKLYESYMGKNSYENITEKDSLKDRGLYGYVWDRREPKDSSLQLLRLRFKPDDEIMKETILLNFGAHPYVNCLKIKNKGKGDKISGDFVFHLGEYIEKNNYNFIFINGPIAAVYPTRLYSGTELTLSEQAKAVGNEIGRVSLAMSKSNEEIFSDDNLNPDIYEDELKLFLNSQDKSVYSKWVERKGEQIIEEKELKPLLNLNIKKVKIDVDNPIFYLVGKLRIGSYTILPGENGKYTSFTEVGLLELGGERKIAFIPGELEPAILSGSSAVKSEKSFGGVDFSVPPLWKSADDEMLTVFGIANDAMGYIIPDNDFSMMFLGTGKIMSKLFGNHYLEIFSFGKNAGVSIADGFKSICDNFKNR